MRAMTTKKRTAILISGRGSNMQALAAAARAADYPAEIVLVISNRPDAAGLQWAKANGLATLVIDHKAHASRAAFEGALQQALDAAKVELIALAGFMRLMTPDVRRTLARSHDQHPPVAAAELQRVAYARTGAGGGSEDRRVHRALRSNRDGHRPDHRPSGRSGAR